MSKVNFHRVQTIISIIWFSLKLKKKEAEWEMLKSRLWSHSVRFSVIIIYLFLFFYYICGCSWMCLNCVTCSRGHNAIVCSLHATLSRHQTCCIAVSLSCPALDSFFFSFVVFVAFSSSSNNKHRNKAKLKQTKLLCVPVTNKHSAQPQRSPSS